MTRRRITPEERALWRRATSTVRPIRCNTILGDHENDGDSDETILKKAPKTKNGVASGLSRHGKSDLSKHRQLTRPHAPPPSPQRQAAPDPFRSGDPKVERRVRRGRRSIDAVFDLHGHTQSSARAALYGFLLEARARNYACVLIITGKGVRREDDADAARWSTGGVLRARFQDWVREDDFRQHIVRVSAAHERHGGGGAFYVFLKRKK